jgi:carbonic anhydrase
MVRNTTRPRRNGVRSSRPAIRPALESLENRTVMNASPTKQAVVHTLAKASVTAAQTTPYTISGRITNDVTGKGVGHVRVQLINPIGLVSQTTFTGPAGNYAFKVKFNGPYVVREVTPKGFVQTGPTFASTAPVGSYAPGRGMSSWNYKTGNNDPNLGPVGPANWSTIAPEGAQPFESPINITGPTIDLGQVLTVNYANSVPSHIINNGAQIQVQFPAGSGDSITLGGQQFNLSQFHYHDPAENQVDGVTFPMEEHFVNVSASGAETVLGVFLQVGAHNDALDPILNAALASLTTPNSSTTISTPIDFAGLLPTSMQGWYYQGSLTTPPLSQVVNWLVFATPITLDFGQLLEYQTVANDAGFLPNARTIQPLYGRQVNEVDYDIFPTTGSNVSGLNFSVAPAASVTTQTSLGSSNIAPNGTIATADAIRSLSLPIVQANSSSSASSIMAAASAQGFLPVAGCNCPLCQMLRNAVWHQVTQASVTPAAATPAVTNGAAAML